MIIITLRMWTYTDIHDTMTNSTEKDKSWEATVLAWIQDHSDKQLPHLTTQEE